MATIQLSDALHKKLMELAMHACSQDNRATAAPFFYQIKQTEMIGGVDGDYDWDCKKLCCDGSTCDVDRESMILELQLNGEDIDFTMRSDNDLQSLLEDTYGYTLVYFRKVDKFTGAFLTEKSCKEHIQLNKHHYTDPVDFLQYAWRNPDMEIIWHLLKELALNPELNSTLSYRSSLPYELMPLELTPI